MLLLTPATRVTLSPMFDAVYATTARAMRDGGSAGT